MTASNSQSKTRYQGLKQKFSKRLLRMPFYENYSKITGFESKDSWNPNSNIFP